MHNEDGFQLPMWDAAALNRAYPRSTLFPGRYEARLMDACRKFSKIFEKGRELRVFSAPGRSELGGNHTDHQHGHVLAAAIDLDVLGVAAKNDALLVRMHSEGYAPVTVDLNHLQPLKREENTSSAILRGIAAKVGSMGYSVGGFDLFVTSKVLKGSGLSSSAAFEVLVGAVINGLFCAGKLTPIEIAQIGQYAENRYFGKPSGLMDQLASSVGGVVTIDLLDTEHPHVTRIETDFTTAGYAFVMVDSGADHANLTGEYSAVAGEMTAVAELFHKPYLRALERDTFYSELGRVRQKLGDRAALRAIHFFGEDERAMRQAKELSAGDIDAFMRSVRESGRSSYMYLQNISVSGHAREQAVAVTLALAERLLGGRGAFRIQGGGFAGAIQAYVPLDMLEWFRMGMERMLFPGCCHIVAVRPAGAIELTAGKE